MVAPSFGKIFISDYKGLVYNFEGYSESRGPEILKLRWFFSIAVVSLFVLLTGCVKGDFHVTVNKNGSAELDYKLALQSQMLGLMSSGSGQKDPIQELKTSFEKEGFAVSQYREGEYVGVNAKKHLDNLKGIADSLPNQNLLGKNQGNQDPGTLKFTEDKGLFSTTYRYSGAIDMTGMKPDGNDTMGLQQMMLKQMDLKLTLTLPVKAEAQNASRVLSDQQTYQWDLIPGTKGDIILQARVPNITNIVISVFLLVVLALVITVYIRRRKKIGMLAQPSAIEDIKQIDSDTY